MLGLQPKSRSRRQPPWGLHEQLQNIGVVGNTLAGWLAARCSNRQSGPVTPAIGSGGASGVEASMALDPTRADEDRTAPRQHTSSRSASPLLHADPASTMGTENILPGLLADILGHINLPFHGPIIPMFPCAPLMSRLQPIGHRGWLDNYHLQHAAMVRKRQQLQGLLPRDEDDGTHPEDGEPTQTVVPVEEALRQLASAEHEHNRAYCARYEPFREALAEDDEETRDAREALLRRRKRKGGALADLAREHLPEPVHPHDTIADWPAAFAVVEDDIANHRIPKDNFSDRAYLEHVPELEDPDPKGERPTFTLRPHQREALGWWLRSIDKHGGFLFSDEMGLGKTPVTVARVKVGLVEAADLGVTRRSLIVVPLSLMPVWRREFARCPSIKLCVYHTGVERGYSMRMLETYDVILTTYDIVKGQYHLLKDVEHDFTAMQDGYKLLLQRRHREWVKAHPKTTHGLKAAEFHTKRVKAPLLAMQFYEEIVDEAHVIRGQDVARGHALRHVRATGRVCITGTPVQNDYWDVFSLFRFLRLAPFDRKPFFKLCFIDESHGRSKHSNRQNKDAAAILAAVIAAVQLLRRRHDDFGAAGEPLIGITHPHEICTPCKLSPSAALLQGPTEDLWNVAAAMAKKREQDQRPDLNVDTPAEDDEETDVATLALKTRLSNMEEETIFKRIREARLNAIHPLLVEARYGDEGLTELEQGRDAMLNVLSIINGSGTATDDPEPSDEPTPPPSRSRLTRDQWEHNRRVFRESISSIPHGWVSDKIGPIVEIVGMIVEETEEAVEELHTEKQRKEYRARDKIIISSEFLAAADLLHDAITLRLSGVHCLRYDGHCSPADRLSVCDRFEEKGKDFAKPDHLPDEAQVLIVNIRAVDKSLTLVHARHVIFIEPHWNPFLEDQALGCAHRIGQTGQVMVYRFPMLRSIEDRIGNVQADKRAKVNALQDQSRLDAGFARIEQWTLQQFRGQLEKEVSDTEKSGLTNIME
ncbi:hypothetical protein LTR53_008263 [Teratosphaeriaceae sp. CCFEE 6253]|nr:hypothetical protein LTR53_008263 [Teratosphaeriaceae sp. CCFEE 6253]